jgi:gliding motility-associated-like protein
VLVFIVSINFGTSQNQVKKWYFGGYAALDFATNPPTALTNGSLTTWEGCSSIADASGNLLFYTNGIRIWNKAHTIMANGSGLLGDNSSAQSALIVKQPGSNSLYFVITTDGVSNGLRYSAVDMSLAAGMGSVTVKNVLLFSSSTERLCAAMHCNGNDIWLISHDKNSNVFRSNLISSVGASSVAVLSPIGTYLYGSNAMGCMKVSPNGKKLGTAVTAPNSFELYDFDASTGVVSNSLSLPVSGPGYGCEFSPNSSKFYGTISGSSIIVNRLYQWDLCAGANTAILASTKTFSATHTGQLQLGPDGKIYQARAVLEKMRMSPEITIDILYGTSVLGVIHNPNEAAININFNNTAQSVYPGVSLYGLPNFVSGFFKTPLTAFSYSINPALSCTNVYFSSPPLINSSCNATGYTISNVKWLFGDTASGASNISTAFNSQHNYPGIGNYVVRLVLYNSCGGVIDTIKQQVAVGAALINNANDFSICTGQSLTLAASGSSSYTWSTGATTSSITVTPSVNTTYSVAFTGFDGCPRKSVQTITVSPLPVIKVVGKDTLCAGNIFTLTVSGTVSYSWSTGSTNSTIKVLPLQSTTYSVTGTSINGCSVTKLVPVVVKPSPIPSVTGNTLICAGSAATIIALGNDTYVWNTGTQGPTFTVVPDDAQWIFSVKAIYNNGCARFKIVRLIVKPTPTIFVSGTTTLCAGRAATMNVTGANSYSWSNGATNNPALLTPTASSNYTVTGIDTNNCTNSKTFFVSVTPSTFSSAAVSGNVSICEGESALLQASGGNQYVWKPALSLDDNGNDKVVARPSVTTNYSVTISNNNVCGITKTILVSVKPTPKIFVGRDTVFNLEKPMFITASGSGDITWISGDGIACAECLRTQIFPVERTCYQAQAVGSSGCIAIDEICVDVGTQFALYTPNSFTPNGDGLNDEFIIKGFGISDIHLNIFDRWGEKLFSSSNETENWNGSYKGKVCETGTYYWQINFVSANGLRQQKTGLVNLLLNW